MKAKSISTQTSIIRSALFAGGLLLIPMTAMQFTGEVQWTVFDFFAMGTLLFVTGMAFELIAKKSNSNSYRLATAVAAITGLLLTWSNLAVGVIGDDNPANSLYFVVPMIGFLVALVGRFEPKSMVHALFSTAIAQMFVPIAALVLWPNESFAPGIAAVFVINLFFAALWITSAMLYRQATNIK